MEESKMPGMERCRRKEGARGRVKFVACSS